MKNNPFPQPICEQIWNAKYRLITPNPDIKDDMSVQDTWDRIATACADARPTITNGWTPTIEFHGDLYLDRIQNFKDALSDFGFIPAGRIVAGAGSGRNVTLFNCYVMGTIPDSMAGIFDMLKEAALTMQQGGGIGYDFSPLRPKDSPVKGVDADASGPLTFMDCWDAMCRTVMSAGSRRGAMMATMRCDHPDIEDFITAKRDSARLRMFNVSVLATDNFMKDVREDKLWPLVHDVAPADTSLGQNHQGKWIYKWVKAKELWNLIMESTYNYAEPGVLFIDRINDNNNLWYMEDIAATNPCGEQPLPPYGACLLGSINLTQIVLDPFSKYPTIDHDKLDFLVNQAVEMLDSIIDISNFPIPQQREEALAKRRMGLGITGLADMLYMLNMKYGSAESAKIASDVMGQITLAAYRKSIELAKLFGPCPATKTTEQRQKFLDSGFMQQMPDDIRKGIFAHGIRNALLTSIAPTGTISLYAGNVSSGVEPIFAPSYTRKVLQKDGTKTEELVEDYAVKIYRELCESDPSLDPVNPNLVTAQTLTPHDHLVMQAAVQRWVDSSISKTINCPEDISFEAFSDIYQKAYDMGCKGCTTYRPNAVTGSVLSVEPEPKKEEPPVEEAPVTTPTPVAGVPPLPRDRVLDGQTYKIKWNNINYYVTINNHYDVDGRLIPFEMFINAQDMSNFQWATALTRMMSSVFRRGGDISFVIEDLKSIMDPNGGAWVDGRYEPSFIALLGRTLEQHVQFLSENQAVIVYETDGSDDTTTPVPTLVRPMQCTQCKGFNVQLSGGCPVCGDCGHSKCG